MRLKLNGVGVGVSNSVTVRIGASFFPKRMLLFFVATAVALFTSTSLALKRNYGPHSGYVAAAETEKDVEYVDMIPIAPPPDLPSFNQRIFNDSLLKEFRDRYEEKFGRTEVERVYNSPNKYSYYNDLYGFKGTAQEMDLERRRYGDFVLRRLLEYHVDNYAKNDPKVRPVWEAKERLKDIRVQIHKIRIDFNYSIAGNTLDVNLYNPYFPLARTRVQMDPAIFGPADVKETTFSIGRPLTVKTSAEVHYALTDGLLSLIQRRSLTPALGCSFTESWTTKATGTSPRERKFLAGISYYF